MLKLPQMALGELELAVLDVLWSGEAMSPNAVHAAVDREQRISSKTVASALKRLFEKGILRREKVSHSYEYSAAMTRAELQRSLIGAVAAELSADGGLMAAFVDIAEAEGDESLRRLERLVAARLNEGG